jgi:hypothetical protein
MAYPTRGIELVVPSNAETEITGWLATVNFNRRGHDYSVQYLRCGLGIERDGEKVRAWDDLPPAVQKIIVKAKANFAQA